MTPTALTIPSLTKTRMSESKIKKFNVKRETLVKAAVILAALLLAFLVSRFAFRLGVVAGDSMEDTLRDGDFILISKMYGDLTQGDIISFHKKDVSPGTIVKRICAVGGDRVQINEKGEMYVNGELFCTFPEELFEQQDYTLAPDEFFVLGDNRAASNDSRYTFFGPVNCSDIEGKVVLKYFKPVH